MGRLADGSWLGLDKLGLAKEEKDGGIMHKSPAKQKLLL